jgi:GTP cyclohydrolase II
VFSEALTAIDCDCAEQLYQSLALIAAHSGLVIYVYEEGRGAGLSAKFAAIALQQSEGIDTAEAFRRLGLEADPRAHKFASAVIAHLIGSAPVVLLTNNPHKVEALTECGVNIVSRMPLLPIEGSPADAYLQAKARVLGHKLSDG